MDELLDTGYCKILETPRYVNKDILVFKTGVFYNWKTKKIYFKRRPIGKTYTTIYVKTNDGFYSTMIVPYIVCALFQDDAILKHGKGEYNYFQYIDGNPDNCSANNIKSNYYDYDVVEYKDNNKVVVNISGYNVLLNLEFFNNELHKYKFHPISHGKCVYFDTSSWGVSQRLHKIVVDYYNPDKQIIGVIDHYNHDTLDNTIENLIPTNFVINSMNNMDYKPTWIESKQIWRIRYSLGGKRKSPTFSVYKYGTKEKAYEAAINYINETLLVEKREFIKNKEIDLKIKEIDSIIKYFLKNNMIDKLKEILLANNLDIVDLRGVTDETIKENQKESKTSDN